MTLHVCTRRDTPCTSCTAAMKHLAIALLGTLSLAAGCAVEAPDDIGGGGGDGKADGSPNVTWDEDIEFIVPKNVHEYLEKYQWGDYHIVFHMSRKWSSSATKAAAF